MIFFNELFTKKNYLNKTNIPTNVIFVNNKFTPEDDLPVIYGNDQLDVSENDIYCGIDILGSCFFMLTRWEEFVNKTRDFHNRFPASASLAYKFGFLDRPVVNEYIEMLWNMLKFLGYEGERKQHKYEMLLTHDVDVPFKYKDLKTGIREIGGDILKRHSLSLAIRNTLSKLKSHINPKQDPFYTFDFLMEQSEKLGLKSHFFFMGGGITDYDNCYNLYSKKNQQLVKEIQNRGHIIGFHPSYGAYNNSEQWKKEKDNVEKALNLKVKCGREHYLRFEAPFTWQIWEDNDMEWDTTLSYADHEGFRCGTCWEYPVFNFITRKQLKLREKPLIVMEGSLFTYQPDISSDKYFQERVKALKNKCKKYKGTFVYLWHNSTLINQARKNIYIQSLTC